MNIENEDAGEISDDEYLEEYTEGYSDDYDDGEYADDDYREDEEFEDDQEFEEDHVGTSQRQSRSRKKKRRMFCRGCNRMEGHRRASRKSWLDSYITGLTFGLNRWVGPFKCTCCGTNRWIIRLKKSNTVTVKR